MQKYTFVVHSPFPEHIAGRCIGYTPTGGPANAPTGTDGGIASADRIDPRELGTVVHSPRPLSTWQAGQRLSEILSSPSTSVSSLRAAQSSSAARTPRTRKTTRFASEDEYEDTYNELDLEAILSVVASALQSALSRLSGPPSTPPHSGAPARASTPGTDRVPLREDDEEVRFGAGWQEAGYPKAGPSTPSARIRGSSSSASVKKTTGGK